MGIGSIESSQTHFGIRAAQFFPLIKKHDYRRPLKAQQVGRMWALMHWGCFISGAFDRLKVKMEIQAICRKFPKTLTNIHILMQEVIHRYIPTNKKYLIGIYL